MNILTFDIEEWFHILDNDSTRNEKEWNGYESRIDANMERIFQILETHNVKATFFVLGWIAKKYPEIVRRIDNAGYEVASHSSMHQLVYEQTAEEFRMDVDESVKTLEDIIGKKVITYRAPGFSITEKCKWAFEILAEAGILYDSSLFPAQRIHGGFPSFPGNMPARVIVNGLTIREFPINIKKFAGKNLVFSGGGYFRIFPYRIIKFWTKNNDYVMSYLHPRDFDPEQPLIKDLPLTRKFRSYTGLKHSEKTLRTWLTDFSFTDIRTAASLTDWDKSLVVKM